MDEEPDGEKLEEGCCPSYGGERADEEAGRPLCGRCDVRLDRELAAYLSFVAVTRE